MGDGQHYGWVVVAPPRAMVLGLTGCQGNAELRRKVCETGPAHGGWRGVVQAGDPPAPSVTARKPNPIPAQSRSIRDAWIRIPDTWMQTITGLQSRIDIQAPSRRRYCDMTGVRLPAHHSRLPVQENLDESNT